MDVCNLENINVQVYKPDTMEINEHLSLAWIERAGQLAAGGVASVWI